MKNLNCVFPGLALAALLTACGGGDDDPPFAADKYVGTWSMCTSTGATTSEKETLILVRGTAINTLDFTSSTTAHFAAGCTGFFGTPQTQTGTVTFNGTKVIGNETVDRVFIGGGLGEKQVLVVRATSPQTMTTGRSSSEGGTLDADGYPTTLDTNVFVRQ